VIGTHPHSDHIGGPSQGPKKNIRVTAANGSGCSTYQQDLHEDYLTLIYEKDILYTNVKAGVKLSLG